MRPLFFRFIVNVWTAAEPAKLKLHTFQGKECQPRWIVMIKNWSDYKLFTSKSSTTYYIYLEVFTPANESFLKLFQGFFGFFFIQFVVSAPFISFGTYFPFWGGPRCIHFDTQVANNWSVVVRSSRLVLNSGCFQHYRHSLQQPDSSKTWEQSTNGKLCHGGPVKLSGFLSYRPWQVLGIQEAWNLRTQKANCHLGNKLFTSYSHAGMETNRLCKLVISPTLVVIQMNRCCSGKENKIKWLLWITHITIKG